MTYAHHPYVSIPESELRAEAIEAAEERVLDKQCQVCDDPDPRHIPCGNCAPCVRAYLHEFGPAGGDDIPW